MMIHFDIYDLYILLMITKPQQVNHNIVVHLTKTSTVVLLIVNSFLFDDLS